MGKAEDNDRWLPAAHALQFVSRHFNATLGLDDEFAKEKAIIALIERLASGTLFASPKGFLLPYADSAMDVSRWYYLWLSDADGRKTKYQADIVNEGDHVVIPVEFWRPFQRGDDRALTDWDAGDFRLDDVRDSGGTWLGWVRDVHFDRLDLPTAWFAQAHDQVPPPDALKGTLPATATNSDRQHEVAAHEAAQVMREARCRLAEAIRRIRHLADPKGRSEDSIDRAIRRSYRLMYDAHGLPIKN